MSPYQKNVMELSFSSLSQNESFARVAVAAFVSQLDPTVEQLTDIKTVVSEAVTNAVIHGYEENGDGVVYIRVELERDRIRIQITDQGIGIQDISEARQPLYTSKPELERSGMGFTIMENFMDEVTIHSKPNQGTSIYMVKYLKNHQQTMAN
ncbi:stage II sporulation protein AB (anti-sigma F factor) [Seinonella peptonophila]|uniref:Anti-sigma F factor n=1 Tax=Seinonella peptonophila TaxID=112248 RepID=A0A1M4TKA8_9BACL|nr:anti-sigma F factor [Seinonella peptonophila]SHE44717.1 stage II sporulation protein AB (anti-sigma F factor) [Seinonella peptonophila]